ncbi:MAG: WbqC family protein [Bacteroidota bacterium]|nr:WbqC family protein [Bacteroidota bacterium]
MSTAILPTAYLGPLQYYSKLKNHNNCIIEIHEHFPKQTYRSRCDIYSPNGILTLSLPLVKRNHRQAVKEVKISYEYDWQKLHWRSLESCYRRSPFFEYYEDDFLPFYTEKKFEYLIDLNESLNQKIIEFLKLKLNCKLSLEYQKEYVGMHDYRSIISPKKDHQDDAEFKSEPYWQVFETKHGFFPNLSVLDLLFNQGSKAQDYL